jgi:hypothetical protein
VERAAFDHQDAASVITADIQIPNALAREHTRCGYLGHDGVLDRRGEVDLALPAHGAHEAARHVPLEQLRVVALDDVLRPDDADQDVVAKDGYLARVRPEHSHDLG